MVKVIIHTSTKIISRVTSDANPPLSPFESTVDVPDNFNLSGKQAHKLNADLSTSVATKQEISDALDDYRPGRGRKRALLKSIKEVEDDPSISNKLKEFCSNLKHYFGTNLPGDEDGA